MYIDIIEVSKERKQKKMFETHEELVAKAFNTYRNSTRLNQNLSDTEIANKLNNMNDAFLYGFIEHYK